MSLRTAMNLDMLVPTFAGDIWSVARYASQCDVHTKLNALWVRVMCFMFYRKSLIWQIAMWGQVIMGDKRPCETWRIISLYMITTWKLWLPAIAFPRIKLIPQIYVYEIILRFKNCFQLQNLKTPGSSNWVIFVME